MSTETRCAWKLPQIVEIDSIHPMCDELAKLTAQGTQVVALDVEDVVIMDTAALQALVAFARATTARCARLEWENLSIPLYAAAETLNLQEALAL
jgi:ABC-type transporter Mla MlaB component